MERCRYYKGGEIRCSLHRSGKQYCKCHEIQVRKNKTKTEPKVCPICMNDVDRIQWFGCGKGCCHDCIVRLCKTLCPFCTSEDISSCITSEELQQINRNSQNNPISSGRPQNNISRELTNIFFEIIARNRITNSIVGSIPNNLSGININNRRDTGDPSVNHLINTDPAMSTLYNLAMILTQHS